MSYPTLKNFNKKLTWADVIKLPYEKVKLIEKEMKVKYHIIENEEHWEEIRNIQTLITDSEGKEVPILFSGTYSGGLCCGPDILLAILYKFADVNDGSVSTKYSDGVYSVAVKYVDDAGRDRCLEVDSMTLEEGIHEMNITQLLSIYDARDANLDRYPVDILLDIFKRLDTSSLLDK